MLQITIPSIELWDNEKETFIYTKEIILKLEHSLLSISKWESKHLKRFYSKEEKTNEETNSYIKCMCLTEVSDDILSRLTMNNIQDIDNYIHNPMTATTINDIKNSKNKSEELSSELIYFYMISNNIPFDCEKWHINRLLTLIRVCNIKNDTTSKKMSKKETANKYSDINKQRKQQMNTKG